MENKAEEVTIKNFIAFCLSLIILAIFNYVMVKIISYFNFEPICYFGLWFFSFSMLPFIVVQMMNIQNFSLIIKRYKMENKAEEILKALKVDEEVLAIFPYGSRVYGTASETSDHDYIIVTKGAFLKSGAFRQNAISSEDKKTQGVLYSRSGFIDALNNYEIGALECLFLNPSLVVLSKWPFKVQKWNEKDLITNIIRKASASWHIASEQSKAGWKDSAKKGIFHALRILMFGNQLKEHKKIIDFTEANYLWEEINKLPEDMFDDRMYIKLRDELIQKLKG